VVGSVDTNAGEGTGGEGQCDTEGYTEQEEQGTGGYRGRPVSVRGQAWF